MLQFLNYYIHIDVERCSNQMGRNNQGGWLGSLAQQRIDIILIIDGG